jgi:SAM-dependent methyltransferase
VDEVAKEQELNHQAPMGKIDSLRIPASSDKDDRIEILSVASLQQNPSLIKSLKDLAHSLHLEFGWHYLLDLVWIIENLGVINNKRIMDAGAGVGVIQWYLAQQGADVISVDRLDRADLAMNFRSKFRVQGLRESDLIPKHRMLLRDATRDLTGPFYRRWTMRIITLSRDLVQALPKAHGKGRITIYNQDLSYLKEIPSESLDAVVSVSALEHNTKQGLERVVTEIMRVIKPNGRLLATVAAAKDRDWWHEPSLGWCLTEASIRHLFHLNPGASSNFGIYSEFFEDLTNCADLRDNLASFYFKSDQNGMPWGKWDPKYIPVGICKIKRA